MSETGKIFICACVPEKRAFLTSWYPFSYTNRNWLFWSWGSYLSIWSPIRWLTVVQYLWQMTKRRDNRLWILWPSRYCGDVSKLLFFSLFWGGGRMVATCFLFVANFPLLFFESTFIFNPVRLPAYLFTAVKKYSPWLNPKLFSDRKQTHDTVCSGRIWCIADGRTLRTSTGIGLPCWWLFVSSKTCRFIS